MDEALVKQLKQKIAGELRQREMEFITYYLEELLKIEGKRHQELAALQNDLKQLINRVQNRLKTLKTTKIG